MKYYIISDVHVTGKVEQLRNFHLPYFIEFIKKLNQRHSTEKATLVSNGDFFDFYSVENLKAKDDPEVIKAKLKEIKAQNPQLFQELGQWCQNGNRLIFIWGNHEYPLEQNPQKLNNLIKEIFFPKGSQNIFYFKKLRLNKSILIEHGHRWDIFHDSKGKTINWARKNLRETFVSILRKYPNLNFNRNVERNLVYVLPLINPWFYLKSGLKGSMGYFITSIFSIRKAIPSLFKKKLDQKEIDLKLNLPPIDRNFLNYDFSVGQKESSFFKRFFSKIRLQLFSWDFEFLIKHKGKLRSKEKRMLKNAYLYLKENPGIKHYIVGHYHLSLRAHLKETGQYIYASDPWLPWVPFLEMIDPKNKSMVSYWLRNIKETKDNIFTRSSRQFSWIVIEKGKIKKRHWNP